VLGIACVVGETNSGDEATLSDGEKKKHDNDNACGKMAA
jgi:hypothetical protein